MGYRSLLCFALSLFLLLAAPVRALEAQPVSSGSGNATAGIAGGTIGDIKVEGNERIESRTIISYLGLTPGARFTQADIDNGLKNLYATGFFADVQLLKQGNALIVRVVENPVVSRVAFEGNDRIDTKDLEKELELKPRSIYSQDKVQSDVKRILDIYRRSGRYSATVEPKLIKKDQNRVELVYEITEGPVARVEKISFIGNEHFDTTTLRKAIRTEETRWYKFLTDNDKFDPDRLQFDQELLRRFYNDEGYADFQVKSANAELSPKKDAFYLTFVVEEGPQYKFGEVKIANELEGKEKPNLQKLLTTKAGKIYDASKVEDSIDAMTKELGNHGYAFVDIQPKLDRDKDKRIANLTYVIKPGPRVYVERINITGNVRTLDEVIRREFRLSEGDAYNTAKLQRTEQRLNNLGFFEKVTVKDEPGSAPDKTVVDVDVKEKSTGEINIGAGYSTTDGVLGDFGIKEKNLMGTGQELNLNFIMATYDRQAQLGFTNPYFLDRELAAGFDIYRNYMDFTRESSYVSDVKGITLRGSYALQEKLQHSFYYTIHNNTIKDVPSTASLFIQDQEGTFLTSAVGHSLSLDERDNKFNPTRGYYLSIAQEVAGLGGYDKYLKHEVKASYYYPVANKWTLAFLGSGGNIFGFSGQDIRINNRFYLGADNFRGFEIAGVGPRDTGTRDALGGNDYYLGTVELHFPLGLPEELGITGAVFTDAGSLWHTDASGPTVFDSNAMRVSSGVGMLWTSPFGPIRIDLAHPFVKQKPDRTQILNFSFGTRF
ncbi:MAG: outer membrane protein assembly factor BamA [Pseudomonadota bacterium]|nr:outer membrane protein assembly factor BamA [Pseudomonadota bacterium]